MKPLSLATVAYPLTGGVDTKTHGLMLPPPKLQTCENAYVDQTGSIQRRYGRSLIETGDQDGVAFNSAAVALGTYRDRLLGYFPDTLYEYTAVNNRWNLKGRATSFKMGAEEVGAADTMAETVACSDMAVVGAADKGYRCYVYDYYTGNGSGAVTATTTAYKITDDAGALVKAPTVIQTAVGLALSKCKVVAVGSRFYIFTYTYADAVTPVPIACTVYNTAVPGGAVVVGNPTLLASSAALFDVVSAGALGPFLVYLTSTANTLAFGFVSATGALVFTSTATTVATPTTLSCSSFGLAHGIAYSCGTLASDVYALIRTWTGSVWTVTATSTAMDTTLSAVVRQVACFMYDSFTLGVWYAGDLNVTRPCTRMGKFTAGVGIAPRVQMYPRVYMATRPARAPVSAVNQSMVYWWAFPEGASTIQPTLYLYTEGGVVSAWANQGVAVFPAFSFDNLGGLPHLVIGGVSNTEYSFAALYYTRFDTTRSATGDNTTTAMRRISFDTASVQGYVGVEDGRELYIPSGFLQQYDGEGVTEVGFLSVVDTVNRITIVAGNIYGGFGFLDSTVGTVYSYHIVPEWTNAQGEREQGTDTGAKTTLSAHWAAGANTVGFTIDCIPWTLKRANVSPWYLWPNIPRTNLVFAVYRTTKNPTALSPFYRVGQVANDPLLDTVTFEDKMSDADAMTKEQLYLGTGEVDNTAVAAGHILAAGNGRVFVAGIPDRPNTVMYSKTREDGNPLAFNETLMIQFPAAHGPITAMCVFNESLVVFTETVIYRVNGDGLSNLGTTGGYTNPVLVQSDAGAVGQRAVIVTPMGIIFESAKGKMLLKSSFTIEYIGAPLEKLIDAGLCVGVVMIPALQQIRFAYGATTHVYDYYHGQWYVFTHASEGPPTLWNEVYTAIQDALPAYDDPAVWTDAGDTYAVTLVLGWMHGSALLGDLAVRKIGLTGQVLGVHNLTVMIAHDQAPVSQVIDTIESVVGPMHHEWRVSRQVCNQIEITIRDAFLNIYNADVVEPTPGFCLNELTFELALRSPMIGRGG